ncbi:MAG: HD domain-containing protein [Chloroflexota bacterium]|nr:HD domain-containing protein [Chloroflexota bacterium]
MGGFLRDSLLRGEIADSRSASGPHDMDIAVPPTVASVEELGREVAGRLGGVCQPHNLARGVYQVIVQPPFEGAGCDEGPLVVDLVRYHDTIDEDMDRRDFTVNAMALPLDHPSLLNDDPDEWPLPAAQWANDLVDPFGGRQDVYRKQIKTVNDDVFRLDPGRLLRGPRLAGQLQFMLAPETVRQIRRDARQLEKVAPERVRDEFMLILAGEGARGQLEVLDRLDLLCRIIPELELTRGVDQPSAHYWDVWNHNLHTVEYAELITRGHQNSAIYSLASWNGEMEAYFGEEVGDGLTRRTVLKLAGLLHDIAKPQTKAPDKTGRIRFLGHSELGAEMVTERLTQLRFSARIVSMVARMVEHHLRPSQLRHGDEDPTPRAVHRYYRDVNDVAVDTIYLALADYLAAKGPEIVADRWASHARMLGNLLHAGRKQAPAEGARRLVTGHDLMQRLNLPPGPEIGRLLEQIDEARAAGEISTREEALALADGLK